MFINRFAQNTIDFSLLKYGDLIIQNGKKYIFQGIDKDGQPIFESVSSEVQSENV